MPQQRRKSNKLHEIEDCLDKIKVLEQSVSDEDLITLKSIKETLQLVKEKWTSLNENYKIIFQEKTDYETELESMKQSIIKIKEEKDIQLKHVEKIWNEKKETLEKEIEDKKIKINDFVQEISSIREKTKSLEGQILSLSEISNSKEQLSEQVISHLKSEKEAIQDVLLEFKDKNSELLSRLNYFTDIELKNKLLNEQVNRVNREKDIIVKKLEMQIAELEYKKMQAIREFEDKVNILKIEKKNLEEVLNELRIKLDKKYKCCMIL